MQRFIVQTRNDLACMCANFCINVIAVGQYREYLRAIIGEGQRRFDEEFWKLYEERKAEQDASGGGNAESD